MSNGIPFNQFFNNFRGFMGNPIQMLMQNKINIPQNMAKDPNAIIQHLMNSGQMNQSQYNQLKQIAGQIQNNPQFQQSMQQFYEKQK
jgi:hypothetical protein